MYYVCNYFTLKPLAVACKQKSSVKFSGNLTPQKHIAGILVTVTRLVKKQSGLGEVSRFLYQLPFKLINNFIFPSVWINEKLTSTCQNHEIGIGIAYFNCSADLVSCSLNKFVGNANVHDISNLSEIQVAVYHITLFNP